MARQNFNLGSNAFVRDNDFTNEVITSPITVPSNGTNVTGAIDDESSRPVRITQFAINFAANTSALIRLRLPNSAASTDGYQDATTTTPTAGERRDFPNIPKFAGDSFHYGFSKGDTTRASFFAGSGGRIDLARGESLNGRQLFANFIIDSVPSAPRSLQGASSGPNSVFLSWSAPSDNGGIPISAYRVLSKASSGNWQYRTNTTSTSASITGLSPNTSYIFAVAAHTNVSDAHGSGPQDINFHTGTNAKITITTDSDIQPATASIVVTQRSQNSIRLQWSTTNSPTFVQVSGPGLSTSNSANGTATATGLNPNTTYTYNIVARNSANTSDATDSVSARTLLPTPTASISAQVINARSARVIWNTSDATTVSVTGDNLTSSSNSGNEIVTNLQPGGIYRWTISASNNDSSVGPIQSAAIQLPNVVGGVWNGGEWAIPTVRVWSGSQWTTGEVRVWTGSQWKQWV